MTDAECKAIVDRILTEDFEVDPGKLEPEAELGKDLGLDSLDAVDLVVSLEKHFGCRMQPGDVQSMRKLHNIYDYITTRKSALGKGAAQ